MKTQGERFRHVRENVLKMTRIELGAITGKSHGTFANIEAGTGGGNALSDVIETLGLNTKWLETGKGSMWLSGTDEENVARIKQGSKSTATTSDPWKDEAYTQIKQERDRLLDDVSKYKAWMNRIMNGEINFLAPLGNKASYGKLRIAKP